MKIIERIKAFFTLNGKKEEIELTSAEVRENGVFLHPKDDPEHTFCVTTKTVDIIINPNGEITDDDIWVIDNKKTIKAQEDNSQIDPKDGKASEKEKPIIIIPDEPTTSDILGGINLPQNNSQELEPERLSKFLPKKKNFSVLLYQDEYDMLIENIKELGYKRTEYFLACMVSAKKQSLQTTYKQYTAMHEQRKKEDIENAKRAQEEDFNQKKNATP